MKFFINFLKNPKKVAAIKPSSRALAKKIANAVDLSTKKSIVELGSGTGVFTKQIVNNISPDSLFFAMEINRDFVEEARREVPNAITYEASAKDISIYLSKHGKKSCDIILSGLPWATLHQKQQKELMDIIYDTLEEGGEFLTIANIQGLLMSSGKKFRKLLDDKFRKVYRTKIVWMNFMPSFVYVCVK